MTSIIGTGDMGHAIGTRARAGGNPIQIVDRDPVKAGALADKLGGNASSLGDPLTGEIVVLALWYDAARSVVQLYGDALAGKIVIDITNPKIDGQPLDVFIAGDDTDAKATVSVFVESCGMRPVDVGDLFMARYLEGLGFLQMAIQPIRGTNFTTGIKLIGG